MSCPSAGVSVDVEFNAPVTSVLSPAGATLFGTTVSFPVDDLEASPTNFAVMLDTCNVDAGTAIVSSVTYADSQGNTPDMSVLQGAGNVMECAGGMCVGIQEYLVHFKQWLPVTIASFYRASVRLRKVQKYGNRPRFAWQEQKSPLVSWPTSKLFKQMYSIVVVAHGYIRSINPYFRAAGLSSPVGNCTNKLHRRSSRRVE